MLERWLHVCHVKITMTLLLTNHFVSTTTNSIMTCIKLVWRKCANDVSRKSYDFFVDHWRKILQTLPFYPSNCLFQEEFGSYLDRLLVHNVPVLQLPRLLTHIEALEKLNLKYVIFISRVWYFHFFFSCENSGYLSKQSDMLHILSVTRYWRFRHPKEAPFANRQSCPKKEQHVPYFTFPPPPSDASGDGTDLFDWIGQGDRKEVFSFLSRVPRA